MHREKKMKETVGAKRKKNIARGNCNKKTFRKLGEYVGKKKQTKLVKEDHNQYKIAQFIHNLKL